MLPPEHPYLENTIDGFRAAFSDGADIIEFDVQPTTDGQFVVFHDWTLDCRTNGSGVTREHALAELRPLDLGYGYTADGGKTFPFRGKGVGLMPTLDQVLATKNVSLAEFRNVERRIQQQDRLVHKVREALTAQAKKRAEQIAPMAARPAGTPAAPPPAPPQQ